MRKTPGATLVALALLAGSSVFLLAQQPHTQLSQAQSPQTQPSQTQAPQAPLPRSESSFRSKIELISVTATVLDGEGKLVKDLPKEAFEVYEDNEPRAVTQFMHERVPVSLGLLLDTSDSMFGNRMTDARAAVMKFLFERLDPADEFFVLAFNHAPKVLTAWTSSPDVVRPRLDAVLPSGGTAIYDAVMASLPLLQQRSRQRAALLVISDGADTASDTTLREVRSALMRSDAFVYAIGIDPPVTRPIHTRVNLTALRELTDSSGGRAEIVRDLADLDVATARIAEELNNQYLLGYDSTRAPDGDFHSIRVRIKGEKYRVRARNGYIADPISRRLGLRAMPHDN